VYTDGGKVDRQVVGRTGRWMNILNRQIDRVGRWTGQGIDRWVDGDRWKDG
jgi:hypothetical protein